VVNENLGKARIAKNDEFYTQYADIEREMNAYLNFDADVFRDKTLLLPCDDPEWSNFTKYFAQNFEKLGLKKLISTSYAPTAVEYSIQPSLFETESPQFDVEKTRANGKIFTLYRDKSGDSRIDVVDLEWEYLEGDGDFRSEEIRRLRDEADVVITNPPFSLFREFLSWIVEAGKQFVIIGNMNAIGSKEVFPHIQNDRMWLGHGFQSGNAFFRPLADREYASGVYDEASNLVKFRNIVWFTSLDHGRRHEPLALMTEAGNKKFSKHKAVKGADYLKFDNYDAIEVPFTDAIPSDFPGVMGVPISFLSKYNPEQFEILGTSSNGQIDDAFKSTPGLTQKFVDDYYEAGGKGAYQAGNPTAGLYDRGIARMVYTRLFIRHRNPAK
jgi:hypothetical protein